uniref:Uncharacterized protein n=1 Tax=Marmota marmota marmota TaxID=9994 RepID=A0A8C5Z4F3_MARMA
RHCFTWTDTTNFAQLLLLLLLICFLSGSRWVLSYKIGFLIPSLAILSWILGFRPLPSLPILPSFLPLFPQRGVSGAPSVKLQHAELQLSPTQSQNPRWSKTNVIPWTNS